ncbi:hypothetical protein [Halorubellus salinus]|uniref:hypothetical protein n=1 Tax=Halorubellus salinus TaxID=755309 RepID=UPI001D061BE8|nr:hypothetical protein [Halorubellus salinus]
MTPRLPKSLAHGQYPESLAWFYKRQTPTADTVRQQIVDVASSLGWEFLDRKGELINDAPSTSDATTDPTTALHIRTQEGIDGRTVTIGSKDETFPEDFLDLSTPADYVEEGVGNHDTGGYDAFTAAYLELLTAISSTFDPYYGFVWHPVLGDIEQPGGCVPEDADFVPDRLPWWSTFSAAFLEDLNWMDKVEDAPAWRVRHLSTDGVIIIKTRYPWADVTADHPLDRHLLDDD